MDAFPFSELEWERVSQATLAVLNATLADDHALRQSLVIELKFVLDQLRFQHGDHPILLETEADFANDDHHRLQLYERAIKLACANDLPTYTIRISHAELLHRLGHGGEAKRQLESCQAEVDRIGDAGEQLQWRNLNDCCESSCDDDSRSN